MRGFFIITNELIPCVHTMNRNPQQANTYILDPELEEKHHS